MKISFNDVWKELGIEAAFDIFPEAGSDFNFKEASENGALSLSELVALYLHVDASPSIDKGHESHPEKMKRIERANRIHREIAKIIIHLGFKADNMLAAIEYEIHKLVKKSEENPPLAKNVLNPNGKYSDILSALITAAEKVISNTSPQASVKPSGAKPEEEYPPSLEEQFAIYLLARCNSIVHYPNAGGLRTVFATPLEKIKDEIILLMKNLEKNNIADFKTIAAVLVNALSRKNNLEFAREEIEEILSYISHGKLERWEELYRCILEKRDFCSKDEQQILAEFCFSQIVEIYGWEACKKKSVGADFQSYIEALVELYKFKMMNCTRQRSENEKQMIIDALRSLR